MIHPRPRRFSDPDESWSTAGGTEKYGRYCSELPLSCRSDLHVTRAGKPPEAPLPRYLTDELKAVTGSGVFFQFCFTGSSQPYLTELSHILHTSVLFTFTCLVGQ